MAGAGYKLFNTGDVLTAAQVNTYLMEQSVMVFADAAARTTALSGVVAEGMLSYLKDTNAVEVYNGSAWVASDDPNAIQNTIVDAKGDLITATANDTPARIAVGNSGETLVADSSTSTGLRWTGANQQNPVINSCYDIWQRGTSLAATTGAPYTADRWIAYSGNNEATISRQATGDTTNLPFIQYCARLQRTASTTGTLTRQIVQAFESANSIPYAGRVVTLSFWARKGANFSATNDQLTVELHTSTGTDQNPFSAWAGDVIGVAGSPTLTTTWQRFSYIGTLQSNITQIYLVAKYTPTGTAGANDFFEITGWQIDIGSTALPFRRNSATLAGELAACQRYFWTSDMSNAQIGTAYSATAAMFSISLPVSMRIAPTATYPTTLTGIINDLVNAQNRTPGALGTYVNRVDKVSFTATGLPAASLAAGYPVMINQSGFTWSAEL